MPKYIIERELPGAGLLSTAQLMAIADKSCSVLREMGPSIQWVESFVTPDKIYCVYIAPNEAAVRELSGSRLWKAVSAGGAAAALLGAMIAGSNGFAQTRNYKNVTEQMLLNPSPDDWLMYSRTYDAQRYSPLKQINKSNVKNLTL